MSCKSLLSRVHPEARIDGYPKNDGAVKFRALVHTVIPQMGARRVLEFGIARGAFWYTQTEGEGAL